MGRQVRHDPHYFYPRPPRGGRQSPSPALCTPSLFLSTPSARRATRSCRFSTAARPFLSTPSARRATWLQAWTAFPQTISIHALREEGDQSRPTRLSGCPYFYPRPPRGGRPLRARTVPASDDFYPRPPRGGRRQAGKERPLPHPQFLSTPSARRATRCPCISPSPTHGFLSTPSARRATHAWQCSGRGLHDFYPRPPRGGRLLSLEQYPIVSVISIHALREEGDYSR